MKVVSRMAPAYRQSMPADRDSIQARKNIIEQIALLISTTVELPENRRLAAGNCHRTINLNEVYFQTRSGAHGGCYVHPDSLVTFSRAAYAFSALGRKVFQRTFQAVPAEA